MSDDLRQVYKEVERILDAFEHEGDAHVVLVGGLAVALQQPDGAAGATDLTDPRDLARLVRPTMDIDIGVLLDGGTEDLLQRVFARLGMSEEKAGRRRFVGRGQTVDVLLCRPPTGDPSAFSSGHGQELRPLHAADVTEIQIAGDSYRVRVAGRANLLVQKALAWSDRHAARDLADIATLALVDFVEPPSVTKTIADMLDILPARFTKDVCRIRSRFDAADQPGPIAFANHVRTTIVGVTEEEWDDLQEAVRETAADAVRRLLQPF